MTHPTLITYEVKFMPLYEYHCKDCSKNFEIMRRFSESDSAASCPACESKQTVKMVSVVNARISAGGSVKPISGGGGGCGSCSSSGCASCHH
jgi:putative FmdB family regulatory protein